MKKLMLLLNIMVLSALTASAAIINEQEGWVYTSESFSPWVYRLAPVGEEGGWAWTTYTFNGVWYNDYSNPEYWWYLTVPEDYVLSPCDGFPGNGHGPPWCGCPKD